MTHKTARRTASAIGLLLTIIGVATVGGEQAPATSGPQVTGSWKVSLHGQHIIPVGMELKQDGAKVTGTLMLWNGDVALDGELVNGTFKATGRLEPTDGTPAGDRTVTATVKPDGTLEGAFAGDHGSIKLTAERFTDRPARRQASAAAPSNGDASAFAGRWRLSTGGAADPRTLNLELIVADDAITGTVTSDHAGPLAIQRGRLAGGALIFGVPMGASDLVEFTATLKDHSTLTGTIAGPMGPMTFVGERVR